MHRINIEPYKPDKRQIDSLYLRNKVDEARDLHRRHYTSDLMAPEDDLDNATERQLRVRMERLK